MNELLKALKDFIFRDILYILGGVSIIFSLLFAVDRNTFYYVVCKVPPICVFLYIVSMCYVLGWLIQTIFSIFRIVTTSQSYSNDQTISTDSNDSSRSRVQADFLTSWLYRRFMYEKELPTISNHDQDEFSSKINENAKPRSIAESDRITNQLLICTIIGPCVLISAIFLVLAKDTNCLFRFLFGIIGLLGIVLMLFCRVMLIRLTVLNDRLYNELLRKEQQSQP